MVTRGKVPLLVIQLKGKLLLHLCTDNGMSSPVTVNIEQKHSLHGKNVVIQ